jgi:hypothetical protein
VGNGGGTVGSGGGSDGSQAWATGTLHKLANSMTTPSQIANFRDMIGSPSARSQEAA